VSARRCECGFEASEDTSLLDHLLEEFTPMDGRAADGTIHDEGQVLQTCLCGFSDGTADGLDEHLLSIFTPADRIGLDGKRHAVASSGITKGYLS
jgi:hypothetical protein